MIYLDYAANTPVDNAVIDVFTAATRRFIANPNSSHPLGKQAANAIDKVSEQVAKYFNMQKEGVIYTSGSSESNNLVIKGIAEAKQKEGNNKTADTFNYDGIIGKYDLDLKQIEVVTYGDERDDYFTDIQYVNGQYLVVGYSSYEDGSYLSKFIRYSEALKVLAVESS